MTKVRQLIVIILVILLGISLNSCGQMTVEDEGLDSKSIEEASGTSGDTTTDDTTTDNTTTDNTTTDNTTTTNSRWNYATMNAEFHARDEFIGVTTFDNKIWVIGGYGSSSGGGQENKDVWYSSNGVNWTEATSSASFDCRNDHKVTTFDNKLWLIAGGKLSGCSGSSSRVSDAWYSTDGSTWTQATSPGFSARSGHALVVFDSKMWVIGGLNASNNYLNDVWSTSDGSNWTQVSSSAGFSGRYRHKITVLNGKMWVMGGYTAGSTCINGSVSDVWSSSDGSNWTQVTTSAAWKGGTNGCHRNSFGLVPFNEKLWVIGGYDGSQYNDTWYSSDGSSWTQSLSNASFSARHGHAVTVFDNKVWVIAGLGSIGSGRRNDVWYSSDP